MKKCRQLLYAYGVCLPTAFCCRLQFVQFCQPFILLFSPTTINNSCAGLLNKNIVLKYNITWSLILLGDLQYIFKNINWLNLLGLGSYCSTYFPRCSSLCFILFSLFSIFWQEEHFTRYPFTRLIFISTCKFSYSGIFIHTSNSNPKVAKSSHTSLLTLLASKQNV